MSDATSFGEAIVQAICGTVEELPVSDAIETPIALLPCPHCGGKAIVLVNSRGWPAALCETCLAEIPSDTNDSAVAAWNRRTFVHPSPLASTLAAYLIDGDANGLLLAKDVVMECGLWWEAEGELDRALTEEDVKRFFHKVAGYSQLYHRGAIQISFSEHAPPYWHQEGNRDRPDLNTLRQFLHLCGLFGITPTKG